MQRVIKCQPYKSTHLGSSNRLNRSHKHYCCGYCKLEFVKGTTRVERYQDKSSMNPEAAKYSHSTLRGTWTCSSYSSTLYETHIAGQEESGCVKIVMKCWTKLFEKIETFAWYMLTTLWLCPYGATRMAEFLSHILLQGYESWGHRGKTSHMLYLRGLRPKRPYLHFVKNEVLI